MPTSSTAATAPLLLRGPNDDRPALTLEQDVEHEALLLLIAQRADVTCPTAGGRSRALPDGSMALAVEYVDGRPLDALEPEAIDDALLDAVWRQVERTPRGAARAPVAPGREHPRVRRPTP